MAKEDGSDFTFNGLWAKKWGLPPESGDVHDIFGNIIDRLEGSLSGYNDGVEVWSVNTSLNGSYQYIAGNNLLIDELRLGLGNHFVVDYIQVNAVPVPAAAWLFSSAIIGLGISAKRKRNI